MIKAFAYIRVSGKGQVDGDGFARQSKAIKEYAAAHDIKIVRTFREEGVSGTKDLEDRPAFVEMMAELLANGTKLVLIEKLDRLARDLMIQETIIGEMRKSGFDLISAMEPDLLQNDPTRILMRQMFGAIAQYEKSMIVLKLRGARVRARLKNGKCEGAKVFGHYEGEDAVLERMKALRSENVSFEKIAATLNAEGFAPRRGGNKWYGKTVDRILSR